MSKMSKCNECGSNDLEWHCSTRVTNGIAQGRLNTSDVQPIFYYGCNYCSHTQLVLTGDAVARHLTQSQFRILK